MPIYREELYVAPLQWSDVFEDSTMFIEKIGNVGGDTDHLEELYEILVNKYVASKTRYIEELPFLLAIKRELQVEWPAYILQKTLFDQIRTIEISEVMKSGSTLSNTVQTNDTPVVDADTVPISDLSTLQTNMNTVGNKLQAILAKYQALNINYLKKIYDKTDPLFRQILSDDNTLVYAQEA